MLVSKYLQSKFGFVTKHACDGQNYDFQDSASIAASRCNEPDLVDMITSHFYTLNQPTLYRQEALLLQRNRATRYVSWNIMAVFWLSYWQEALLMHRNHASTLSVEIM